MMMRLLFPWTFVAKPGKGIHPFALQTRIFFSLMHGNTNAYFIFNIENIKIYKEILSFPDNYENETFNIFLNTRIWKRC